MTTTNREKQSMFDDVHANVGSFFVVFDPKHPGVIIPEGLSEKSSCSFNYGQLLLTPTQPVTTPEGLHCDLLFSGKTRPTYVPWAAVYCIHFEIEDGSKRGKIWKGSIPDAVLTSNAKNPPEAPIAPAKPVKTKPTREAEAARLPDGTFSLKAFRENRAARGPHAG